MNFSGIGDRIYGDVALCRAMGICDKPVALASPWQPRCPDGQQRFLLMAVILDVGTKPLQRHVPTRRNLLEIIAEFCELLRLNLPQAVSPDAVTAHETNILSYS